jgi:hypothetical protein
MRTLSEKEQFLLQAYQKIAKAFDEVTDLILERPEADKAQMQVQMFSAMIADFIMTLPQMTPEVVKALVDYVFKCKNEVLGSPLSQEKEFALPEFRPASPKNFN